MEPIERREEVVITEQPGVVRREQVVYDASSEERQFLRQVTNMIWLVMGALEVLILLRIFLKLIAANPNNPFAAFVYNLSLIFVSPFLGLTASPAVGGMVFEIPSVIALLVYGLLTWFVVAIIWTVFEKPRARRISVYERERTTPR